MVGVNSYTLCAIALGLSVRWILITSGMRRRQAWWFTISGSFSVLGALLRNVPEVQWMNPLPLGHLLAGLFITWGFYRWQVYNIFPLAEEAVVQNMFDGLLVVDEYGYIIETNPAAKKICSGLPAAVGGKFQELAAAWPILAEAENNPDLPSMEAIREFPEENRYYQLNVTPLQTKGHLLGKVIILKDITAQKQNQTQLLEQQKSVAIAQERANLARELHDDLYQVLGYINIQSQALMKFTVDGQTAATISGLDRLSDVSRRAYDDLHEYIRGVQMTKMVEKGLGEALREYVNFE